MRKPKIHYATRGNLTADGSTKVEAKASLDKLIDWACECHHTIIEYRFGLIIVISPDSNGWNSTIIDPADMQHGKRRHSSCHYGQVEFDSVLQSARNHAAQNAWSHAVNDDAGFIVRAGLDASHARELSRWIEFQRSYRDFRAQRKTDGEAHALACGYTIA